MFENHKAPLLPMPAFLLRLAWSALFALSSIAISLGIGMLGYHHFESLPWIDAYADASMILSGMGPLHQLTTTPGKIFAGTYALFSGLAFITITGLLFGPIIHRFFHKLHLADEEDGQRNAKKNRNSS